MHRRLIATCAAVALLGSLAPSALAAPPPTWDGLTQVKGKRFDVTYLLPGADFRSYNKVMLDPTDVAFRKNWVRDYNNTAMGLSSRITDAEAREMMDKVRTGFEKIFHKAYTDAGYEVVTEPGPDVLRVRTGVANLYASAPDQQTAGRSRSYSEEAGGATVVVEVRDSTSGALLGRAVDSRVAGDTGAYLRNSVTNRADFEQMFRGWAKISVEGINELKARSPIPG